MIYSPRFKLPLSHLKSTIPLYTSYHHAGNPFSVFSQFFIKKIIFNKKKSLGKKNKLNNNNSKKKSPTRHLHKFSFFTGFIFFFVIPKGLPYFTLYCLLRMNCIIVGILLLLLYSNLLKAVTEFRTLLNQTI